jgi:sulfonate transport system substrate-binding protein
MMNIRFRSSPAALRRRGLLAGTAALGLALGLGGLLGGPPAAAQTAAASPGAAGQGHAPLVRIGFQKGSVSLVLLKQLGTLATLLPGSQVNWVEFPAGPLLLEALAVGSIDFGATGDSPPVFAQAAGKDLLYVGAEPPKPLGSAILVRPESALHRLADLKGRKIALQKGSSSHFLLVQAVARAGLQWSDITPIYLPPADARAAFERGSVDAWVIWDPYYAAAEIGGRTRVLATSQGLTGNNTFYLAGRDFAHRHGPTVQALFRALTQADAYAQGHRKEAAQLLADFSGLDLATVHRFLERRAPAPVGFITPALLAEQQRVADAFAQLGLIPRPVRVADIVWRPGSDPVAVQ